MDPDTSAEIARLRAEQAQDRQRIARLERLVRAADFALMQLLVDVIGLGAPFSVESTMDAAKVEQADGSSVLADAIRAAVGRGGQSVRLGIWLAARQADPVGGVGTRKAGKTLDNAALYMLVEV